MFSSFSSTLSEITSPCLISVFCSPADPHSQPAHAGCACEDEGEESADRRAGRAHNTSQRKTLTPWAATGKTVILFFLPPSFLTRFLLCGSWAEPSWAGAAEPIFVRKARPPPSGPLAQHSTPAFVNEPSTSVLVLTALHLTDKVLQCQVHFQHSHSPSHSSDPGDKTYAYPNLYQTLSALFLWHTEKLIIA